MPRLRRLASCFLLVGLAFASNTAIAEAQITSASACVSPDLARLNVGFTLTHVAVHTDALSLCGADRGATLKADDNIVLHYDRPEMRQRVRAMLRQMAQEGARSARVILWYRLAEDEPMARTAARRDPLGYPVASGGALPQAYLGNLVAFASDVASAGYTRFYVNIGPMGTSNPTTSAQDCRPELPNCYNARFLPAVWSVARQVITRLRRELGGRIDLVFDIASEKCFVPNSPTELEKNLATFTRYIVSQYAAAFGSGGFVVSCIGVRSARALANLQAIASLYRELRVRPAAIDIHLYAKDAQVAQSILLAADYVAAQLQVPLDMSETTANDPMLAHLVEQLADAGRLTNLRTMMIFPHSPDAICHADVSPPYDITLLEKWLGLLNNAGARTPACR
jgi:hypothetical protein